MIDTGRITAGRAPEVKDKYYMQEDSIRSRRQDTYNADVAGIYRKLRMEDAL